MADPLRIMMLADLSTRFEPMRTALVSGDRVHLDAGSAIADDTDSDTRAVTLLQGAAFFDVAKNPRPFVVTVGDLRVRVRGTAFETAWINDVVEVSVSEGRVEVFRGDQSWVLGPGDRLSWSMQEGMAQSVMAIEDVAAWREDQLVVQGMAMGQVAELIDRRLPGAVMIPNAELAGAPVSGHFNLSDPASALRALAAVQNARVMSGGPLGHLILPSDRFFQENLKDLQARCVFLVNRPKMAVNEEDRHTMTAWKRSAAGLVAGTAILGQSAAAEGVHQIDIPAQPLAAAIAELGQETGFQVGVSDTVAHGKISAPIRGLMTPEVALSGLLDGTGLTYRSLGQDGAVVAQAEFVSQNAQDDDLFDLGTLRIGAPEAQALLGNDTITEEELEQRNPSSIRDVFDGESSVTTSGGAAIANKVFVNGIEESLLSVTIDGARQNKSPFHHTGNVLIDPALLKSVEVSRGLAPADAGPNALAGSIAYETKDAADLLEEGDNFGGILSLRVGDNDDFLRGGLTVFGRNGGFEYLLSATASDSDDYEDGDGIAVPGTRADLTNYIGKLAYTSQSGHRFEFAASQTEDTGVRAGQAGPGGIIFVRPDFAGVVGAPSVFVEALSRRTSYTFTYSMEDAQGWLDPTVQLSYNEQKVDVSGVVGTNESFSGTIKNRFQIAGGTLTAGLDFFDESASGFGRGPGPFASSGKEEHRNIGIFAQARQDIGERVSVSYGARYDWQEFDAANGQTFKDDGFSGNGSIDFIITDSLTLNAGYAHSWGGYELGEAALVNFGTPWTYTGFTASRSDSGRIGLRFEQGPWELSGAYFETYVNDINAVLPGGGNRGAVSDLESKGWDASVAYNWASGFVRLNYTQADVKLNNAAIGSTAYYLGRPLGDILTVESAWQIDDQWGVGGSAEVAFDNSDAALPLPGYEVVNLYATYTPRAMENLELRLDARNIFDETYASRSSDGIDSVRVIPLNEPGRSISLTANLKF